MFFVFFIIIILVFIPTLILIWIGVRGLAFDSSKRKGVIGEVQVSNILRQLPDEYFLFDDVYLSLKGRSIQIDHIVVSKYGVFVIETKNYTGWIYGTVDAQEWTKNVYGEKYKFYNPLKQNYFHLKSLQSLLNLPDYMLKSFVVFLDEAHLKVQHKNLVYSSELVDKILSYRAIILSPEQVNSCVEILSVSNVIDKKYREEHLHSIHNEIYFKDHLVKSGVCPRCRGFLVIRKGANREFLGCSNYPKCKYSRSL